MPSPSFSSWFFPNHPMFSSSSSRSLSFFVTLRCPSAVAIISCYISSQTATMFFSLLYIEADSRAVFLTPVSLVSPLDGSARSYSYLIEESRGRQHLSLFRDFYSLFLVDSTSVQTTDRIISRYYRTTWLNEYCSATVTRL